MLEEEEQNIKKMKKMKTELSYMKLLPVSSAARADCFLESYCKRVTYNCLQMLRDIREGILALCWLWHVRSQPRKQEGNLSTEPEKKQLM